jgi:hypothetical protein
MEVKLKLIDKEINKKIGEKKDVSFHSINHYKND